MDDFAVSVIVLISGVILLVGIIILIALWKERQSRKKIEEIEQRRADEKTKILQREAEEMERGLYNKHY